MLRDRKMSRQRVCIPIYGSFGGVNTKRNEKDVEKNTYDVDKIRVKKKMNARDAHLRL